jgi:hypothetical protein
MDYLTEFDITFIAKEQSKLLPSTVSHYRPTVTNTALGTSKTDVLIKTMKCRIAAIGDRRSESVYQHETSLDVQKTDFTHTATFIKGSGVQVEDIIVWNTRRFIVVALLTKNSYETAERCYMTECL